MRPAEVKLADLIDLSLVEEMAESTFRANGMPMGIIDAPDDLSILVGAGLQDVCTKFHRCHPESERRCKATRHGMITHCKEKRFTHINCMNGLQVVATPISISGTHLATLFLGQFFYENEIPDRSTFVRQAEKFNFNLDAYLGALTRVPVFSRKRVAQILDYSQYLPVFLSDLAEGSLAKTAAVENFKKSEENYRLLFENVNQAVFLVEISEDFRKDRLVDANRKARNRYGYTKKEFLGMGVTQLGLHEAIHETYGNLKRVFEKGFHVFEAIHRTKHGERFPVEINVSAIQSQGPLVCTAMVTDISERKKKEEIYRGNLELKEETNAALKRMLEYGMHERERLKENMTDHVRGLVMPHVKRLRETDLNRRQKALLKVINDNLEQVTSRFAGNCRLQHNELTRRELELAALIKNGKTNKEISELLNISLPTVSFHRQNIRKKLGLFGKRKNLVTHLNELGAAEPLFRNLII